MKLIYLIVHSINNFLIGNEFIIRSIEVYITVLEKMLNSKQLG